MESTSKYHELLRIKDICAEADRDIVAGNIRRLLKERKVKVYQLGEILGISKHNAYAYTKEKATL